MAQMEPYPRTASNGEDIGTTAFYRRENRALRAERDALRAALKAARASVLDEVTAVLRARYVELANARMSMDDDDIDYALERLRAEGAPD